MEYLITSWSYDKTYEVTNEIYAYYFTVNENGDLIFFDKDGTELEAYSSGNWNKVRIK